MKLYDVTEFILDRMEELEKEYDKYLALPTGEKRGAEMQALKSASYAAKQSAFKEVLNFITKGEVQVLEDWVKTRGLDK